jgi:Cu/Ag efflux protein CusF
MREMFSTVAIVLLLTAAVPVATPAGTDQARPAKSTGSISEQVITGTVESVHEDTGAIKINGQTLYMTANGEMAVPKVGQKVTYVYEERDGRNVITTFRLQQ